MKKHPLIAAKSPRSWLTRLLRACALIICEPIERKSLPSNENSPSQYSPVPQLSHETQSLVVARSRSSHHPHGSACQATADQSNSSPIRRSSDLVPSSHSAPITPAS